MKCCGAYSNPRIIKDCFSMYTAFHLGYFFLRGKQKSPITNHAKPTLCKECEIKFLMIHALGQL